MKLDIDFSALRRIRPADEPLFAAAAGNSPSDDCEWSFCNLLWWGEVNRVMFLPCEGRLLIYDAANRCNYFPVGADFSGDELVQILRRFRDAGLNDEGRLYDLPEAYYFRHFALQNALEVSFDPGEEDYIYELSRLRELSGPKLRKKRNLVRQFLRENPRHSICRITAENIREAVELAARLNAKLKRSPFLEQENRVMQACAGSFSLLHADGLILYAEPGRAAGFSIFSPINAECVDIHFEKADHDITGASQFLTWAVADFLKNAPFLRMNREQDMGEPGLRRAKNSLDPSSKFRRLTAKLTA